MIKKRRAGLLVFLTMALILAMALPVLAAESTTTNTFDQVAAAAGGVSTVALIIGLVKIAKELGLKSKYASGLAALLGIAAGVTAALWSGSAIYQGVLGGIAAGLLSCGTYDLGKAALSSSTVTTTPTAVLDTGTTTPTAPEDVA